MIKPKYPQKVVQPKTAGAILSRRPVELIAPRQRSPRAGINFKRFSKATMLVWDQVEHAAGYNVEVQRCPRAGCTKGAQRFRVFPLKGTKMSFNAEQPGHWRWRVWAVDRKGKKGPASGWWEFRYTK
jgi:hypothetical protein